MNNSNAATAGTEQDKKHGYFAWFLPFRCILFLSVSLIGAAVTGKQIGEIKSWWSITASAANILTILLLLLLTKKEHISYRSLIRYRKGSLPFKKAAGLIAGFVITGMACMYLAGLLCYGSIMPRAALDIIAPIPPVLAVINAVVLPLTVPFAEDGLYLGCGVNHIGSRTAALLIPAFFYAVQHCFIPTIFDIRYMLYRFLSFLPLTVIFCLYYRKQKNPMPIMISHAILDAATGAMILMTSVSPALYEKWCSL